MSSDLNIVNEVHHLLLSGVTPGSPERPDQALKITRKNILRLSLINSLKWREIIQMKPSLLLNITLIALYLICNVKNQFTHTCGDGLGVVPVKMIKSLFVFVKSLQIIEFLPRVFLLLCTILAAWPGQRRLQVIWLIVSIHLES